MVCFQDNYIFYNTENDGIIKSDLDGSNKEQILPNNAGFLGLSDNNIYFYNVVDNTINVMDLETKEISLLIKSKEIIMGIATEKSIFYVIPAEGQYNLLRYDIKTKESKTIIEDVYKFNFYGDSIVYSTNEGIEEKNDFTLPRNLYISDLDGNMIRKLDKTGNIGKVVGNRMYYWDFPDSETSILVHIDLNKNN